MSSVFLDIVYNEMTRLHKAHPNPEPFCEILCHSRYRRKIANDIHSGGAYLWQTCMQFDTKELIIEGIPLRFQMSYSYQTPGGMPCVWFVTARGKHVAVSIFELLSKDVNSCPT